VFTAAGRSIEIALFNVNGQFYAISNVCQHQKGPLSKGSLAELVVTCPWHGWKYSILDGKSPHEGGDSVDVYETLVKDGNVYVNPEPTLRGEKVTKPHSRYLEVENSVMDYLKENAAKSKANYDRKVRFLGISTTNLNDRVSPRASTSEEALHHALEYAKETLGAETVMIKLRQLQIKDCEGYYSKDARACIFPCSISEMDKEDQMIDIYEKMIIWADVVIVTTPIRWGSASSLYYKMVQRLNSVQNQMVTRNRVLVQQKVGAFIITGGQDNVQHVAGEMLSFWSQLGFVFGKFPFVGWSRGWFAEDTQRNYESMESSQQVKKDIEKMVSGALEMYILLRSGQYEEKLRQHQSTTA
jgi:multimeric flavodoxin WrbA/nitrite reductase/ring-hydroxylating ferredoxin subunit